MKLWGGRFQKETSQMMDDFHSSISFDQRLFAQDIRGSMAHARMLCRQGILVLTVGGTKGVHPFTQLIRAEGLPAHCSGCGAGAAAIQQLRAAKALLRDGLAGDRAAPGRPEVGDLRVGLFFTIVGVAGGQPVNGRLAALKHRQVADHCIPVVFRQRRRILPAIP